MDFSLSEEQTAIQDLARQILADGTAPEQLRAFETGDAPFDRALWGRLAEANLLGVAIDEDVEGMGLGMLELCLLLEEQGRTLAPLPLVAALAEAALPIARFGNETQRRELLPGLADGTHWLSAALEEDASDPARPGTRARAEGGLDYRLDGLKTAVPVAEGALAVVVSARGDDDDRGLYLVDPSAPGVTLEAQRATNHARLYRMRLDGAVGERLGDAQALDFALARGRVALCAVMLGVAQEALRRTAEYVSNRKQFDRPIGTFQGVALRAADGFIDVECMRSTLWQAAWKIDAGRDARTDVAVAKWWACRGGQRVVHSAQHLHGGIGADLDYPIHRYFLWAKQLEVELGGAGRQLAGLGRLLTQDAAA